MRMLFYTAACPELVLQLQRCRGRKQCVYLYLSVKAYFPWNNQDFMRIGNKRFVFPKALWQTLVIHLLTVGEIAIILYNLATLL